MLFVVGEHLFVQSEFKLFQMLIITKLIIFIAVYYFKLRPVYIYQNSHVCEPRIGGTLMRPPMNVFTLSHQKYRSLSCRLHFAAVCDLPVVISSI